TPSAPAPAHQPHVHHEARTSGHSAEVSIGGFGMRQYASLCAELAVYADQHAAVLARYGLPSEEARRRLASLWEQRLLADPGLRRAWTEASAQYREWLLHRKT